MGREHQTMGLIIIDTYNYTSIMFVFSFFLLSISTHSLHKNNYKLNDEVIRVQTINY